MAILKAKDVANMQPKDREKKSKELRLELAKARASSAKGGNAKIKEIKRTIARILTLNKNSAEDVGKK